MERQINGFYWPEQDILHAFTAWKGAPVGAVDPFLKEKRLAVQAGGNCGIVTRELAKRFGVVYTFEPDAENFRYLTRNCPEPKVAKIQAALGEVHGMTGMKGTRQNCGEFFLEGQGFVPVLKLDDFVFPFLDLLYLDCEGFEPLVLRGGMQAIRAHKPVIFCREQTKAWKYGFEDDDIDRMLGKEGYAIVHEEKVEPFPFKVFACA